MSERASERGGEGEREWARASVTRAKVSEWVAMSKLAVHNHLQVISMTTASILTTAQHVPSSAPVVQEGQH